MSGLLVKDSLVHYESLGRGEPVVFIHGWLGSWRYWVPVMDQISTSFRSYALDLWGFGDSDKTREEYDVDSYVELLTTFMDKLGIDHAPLVGHTLGAAVAARVASTLPGRVSKVMAVGLPLGVEAINRKLLTAASNDNLARLFWHRQRPYPEVELGQNKAATNVIALTVQSVVRLRLRQTLDQIDVPLLSVYGGKDRVVSAPQGRELVDNHYSARAIVLRKAHHFPMLDETAKFTRLLRDFLDVENADDLKALTVKKEWRRRTR